MHKSKELVLRVCGVVQWGSVVALKSNIHVQGRVYNMDYMLGTTLKESVEIVINDFTNYTTESPRSNECFLCLTPHS